MNKNIPKLALVSSFAGFGRISITAALPVVSVMQVQACPLPTAVLSSHLAYTPCHKFSMTEHIQEFFNAWNGIGLKFDGIYIGYTADTRQLDVLEQLLTDSASNTRIIVDPVMGDHGKAYSTVTPEQVSKMKKLVSKADLITPNLTESCMLTDTPYHAEGWSGQELTDICQKIDPKKRMQIVITGIREGNDFRNFLWDKGNTASVRVPCAGASRPGTGDIFAAILSANLLKGKALLPSVRQASDFISVCIRDSEASGTPIKEGILFEQNLSRLI